MRDFFATLLATDTLSRHYDTGLNPKLRAAIEAELRFPAKSSGPIGEAAANDPDVAHLRPEVDANEKRQA